MKFSNTNLNLYRTFITLFESLNMIKASELLGLSRQAVGQNIRELEKQLSVRLFTGTNRGVKPTSEAVSLYARVKDGLDIILRAEEDIVGFNEQSSGLIKIATTTSFAGSYLDGKIIEFRSNYPNIRFDISIQSVPQSLVSLESGQVHIILSTIPLVSEKEYKFKQIELEKYEQCFNTTRTFAKANGMGKLLTQEEFNKLPLFAIRTIKHYVSNVREPDVVSDTQNIIANTIRTNSYVTFGIWDLVKKSLGDEAFRFDVEGLKVAPLSLICAHQSEQALTQTVNAFIQFLMDGIDKPS